MCWFPETEMLSSVFQIYFSRKTFSMRPSVQKGIDITKNALWGLICITFIVGGFLMLRDETENASVAALVIVLGIICSAGGLLALYGRFFARRHSALTRGRDKVSSDETQIFITYADGQATSLRWADIAEIVIVTTSEQAPGDDVVWGFLTAEGTVLAGFPQRACGSTHLLETMQARLSGFDSEAVIRAMGSTDNARFVVWRSDRTS